MTDEMDDAIALLEVELGAEVVADSKGSPSGEPGRPDFQGEAGPDASEVASDGENQGSSVLLGPTAPTGLAAPFYRPQWDDNVEEVESEVLNGHPEGDEAAGSFEQSGAASPVPQPRSGRTSERSAGPAAPSLPERPFDKSHVNFPELMSDNRTEPKALVTYANYKMVLEREVVLVYGDPGVGKSLLLLDLLTKGSAAQMDFHGDRVMWVDEEGDEDILRERLLLLKVDPVSLTNWRYYLNRGFYLDVDKTREDLFDKVEAFQPNVVVIDSATRVRLHSDENNATEMARFYSLVLKPLSRTFGCSVLLIDHSRKRGHFDREANQQARGSIEKLAQVDRAWMLRKVGKDSFVIDHAKVRRGTPPPRLLIERYFENFTKTFAHKLKNVLHDE